MKGLSCLLNLQTQPPLEILKLTLKTVWSGDNGRKTGVKCPYLNFPLNLILKKSKAVPLHALEALGRKISIVPTHSRSHH
jgi:hypothetical protein